MTTWRHPAPHSVFAVCISTIKTTIEKDVTYHITCKPCVDLIITGCSSALKCHVAVDNKDYTAALDNASHRAG